MAVTLPLSVRGLLLLVALVLLAPVSQAAGNLPLAQLQQPWNSLLHHYATAEGRMDYEALLDAGDDDQLRGYLQNLRKVQPTAASWTADETKAFWLNTYNAAATNLVLEYYPVASINDIRVKTVGGYESAWETVVVNVGGRNYSLNQIEREMLRDQFHDPRVHFALTYGAAAAAPLRNEAYEGSQLNRQLDEQTRHFINDSACNQLSPGQIRLSDLFRAYAPEFGSQPELLAFVNRYAHAPVLPTATIDYLSFSWALNNRSALSSTQALGAK